MVVRSFLGQLAEALKFLRNQNIIHRDIKPQVRARPAKRALIAEMLIAILPCIQNLLLHPADQSDIQVGHPEGIPLLRVADFGFARALPQQSLAETLCGSPLYMAPEILRYEKYDAKADLWSVGAVTYEMCAGKPPFRAQNHVELLRRIERGEDRIKFPDERSAPSATSKDTEDDPQTSNPATDIVISEDVKALIRRLLKRNPLERLSFSDFFREAEAVARWGEGSIAPGRIDIPATSSGTQQSEPLSSSPLVIKTLSTVPQPRAYSNGGTGTTATSKQASPLTEQPHQSPLISPLPMPSTDAEQEPAFARLPSLPPSRGPASPVVSTPPMTENPSNASSIGNAAHAAQMPPLLHKKSTFAPKYVVGPPDAGIVTKEKSETSGGALITVKTRDFAIPLPLVGAAAPRTASLESTVPLAPVRSNLSLALPANIDRKQELAASGLTGDDDSLLGKEYVVVEKRNVEVNALADGKSPLTLPIEWYNSC